MHCLHWLRFDWECVDNLEWDDGYGDNCQTYRENDFCTDCKTGAGWVDDWGDIANYGVFTNCCKGVFTQSFLSDFTTVTQWAQRSVSVVINLWKSGRTRHPTIHKLATQTWDNRTPAPFGVVQNTSDCAGVQERLRAKQVLHVGCVSRRGHSVVRCSDSAWICAGRVLEYE